MANKSLNPNQYWTSIVSLKLDQPINSGHKLDSELKNLFDAAVLYEYWIDTID